MIREEFEVVVVGAGPAGLASAVTLGSYGVETLVVERRASTLDVAARDGGEHGHDGAAPPLGPRGAGVGAVDRRRVAGMGVRDARRRGSRPVRWRWVYRRASRRVLVSPTAPACLAQDRARAASGGAPRLVRERRARARRRARRTGAGKRRRPRAHARRPRHAPPRPRQVRDRRRRRAQHRAGGARDPIRGRRERCGAPRGRVPGPGLGARRRAPLRHLLPRRGPQLPSRRQAGPLGVRRWNGTAQPKSPTR